MSETIELNKPEFKVMIEHGGAIASDGVYVVKVTYKLGIFNYVRKHKQYIMQVHGHDRIERAKKYCEKLNEAEKEMRDE